MSQNLQKIRIKIVDFEQQAGKNHPKGCRHLSLLLLEVDVKKIFWIALACIVAVGIGSYVIPRAYDAHQRKMKAFHQQQRLNRSAQELKETLEQLSETFERKTREMDIEIQRNAALLERVRRGDPGARAELEKEVAEQKKKDQAHMNRMQEELDRLRQQNKK